MSEESDTTVSMLCGISTCQRAGNFEEPDKLATACEDRERTKWNQKEVACGRIYSETHFYKCPQILRF